MLQVEAWDQDCSPQYSQICNYEIVTAGTPFAIDRNGECVRACVCVCWIRDGIVIIIADMIEGEVCPRQGTTRISKTYYLSSLQGLIHLNSI